MAAVCLFCDTNMAAVTLGENRQYKNYVKEKEKSKIFYMHYQLASNLFR